MERNAILADYLPWALRKDRERRQRVAALRQRDGDDCRRCRRPLRFDLPSGHDLGPKIECIANDTDFLTHGRCNPSMIDHTGEVLERVRRKNEAELLARPRKRRRA